MTSETTTEAKTEAKAANRKPRAELVKTAESGPQKPTRGRIVDYRAANKRQMSKGAEFHSALITRVHDDGTVNLKVWPDGNPEFDVERIAFAADAKGDIENAAPGTWCWPKRV